MAGAKNINESFQGINYILSVFFGGYGIYMLLASEGLNIVFVLLIAYSIINYLLAKFLYEKKSKYWAFVLMAVNINVVRIILQY